mmetsp:Transcript_103700/g.237469  ORF Transcript_103700/g.237469 Transcript_103700/m.237469 type:complete len:172 (-) Transcript_103700:213-728(-)
MLQTGEEFEKQAITFSLFGRKPEKVKLALDDECKMLKWEGVEQGSKAKGQIELVSIKLVEKQDNAGLRLIGSCGDLLLSLQASDGQVCEVWVAALQEAIGWARSAGETQDRPKSAVDTMKEKAKKELYFQKKDMSLKKQKKQREKRKEELMQQVGGGLKYTAVAMANMADR